MPTVLNAVKMSSTQATLNSFLSHLSPFSYRMAKLTAFYADWCDSCHTILPKLKAYARRNGMSFEKIDIDKCSTETCDSVDYIPHILVDGQPVSDKKLEQMIKDG